MTPAEAFHAAASSLLKEGGRRGSQREIAEIIGEPRSAYSRYVAGHHGLGSEKLIGWLAAWRDAGLPEIVIQLGAGGADV